MNLLAALFGKRGSAPVARDRLQILLAHERTIAGGSDLVAILREEILAVIKKHVNVDSEKVQVKMERGKELSTLAVDIEIPTPTGPLSKIARPKEKEIEKKKVVAAAAS
jgi:cell division topological specificity factor